jgi:hypothetical protein
MTDYHVTIDRLILEGIDLPSSAGPRLAAGVSAELGRLLAEGGLAGDVSAGGARGGRCAAARSNWARARPTRWRWRRRSPGRSMEGWASERASGGAAGQATGDSRRPPRGRGASCNAPAPVASTRPTRTANAPSAARSGWACSAAPSAAARTSPRLSSTRCCARPAGRWMTPRAGSWSRGSTMTSAGYQRRLQIWQQQVCLLGPQMIRLSVKQSGSPSERCALLQPAMLR